MSDAKPYTEERVAAFRASAERGDLCWPGPEWLATIDAIKSAHAAELEAAVDAAILDARAAFDAATKMCREQLREVCRVLKASDIEPADCAADRVMATIAELTRERDEARARVSVANRSDHWLEQIDKAVAQREARPTPPCDICGSVKCSRIRQEIQAQGCCGGNDEHPPEHCTDCDACSCTCGHSKEEHPFDPVYPAAMECGVCSCISFEANV